MTANTVEDAEMKIGLIDDVMTVINVEGMYALKYIQIKSENLVS